MQSFLEIRRNFYLAAQNNPPPKDIMPLSVDKGVLRQILSPIKDIYLKYGACIDRDIEIHALVEELRQMCVEAHAIHTTQDAKLKDKRSSLLIALQGLSESIGESRGPYVVVDFDDMFNLSVLTDVLRDSASIYREYMHYPDIADAIECVANFIDLSKMRSWSLGDVGELSDSQKDKIFA